MNALFHRILILCLSVWCGVQVSACSMARSYIRPTNFELVYGAEAIVLAEAVNFEKERSFNGYEVGKFTFKILERVKGEYPADTLIAAGDTMNLGWGPADEFDYQKGDTGPCNAHNYKVGRKYVLLLERFKEHWYVGGPAFSRINVEVADAKAPWAEAVRRYAEVARAGSYEAQKAGLKKLRERAWNDEAGCPEPLISDIDAHFEKATEYKSGADLLELFQKASSAVEKERAIWAFGNKKEPIAKAPILAMLKNGEWREFAGPVCSYVEAVGLREAFGILTEAFVAEKDKWTRRTILFALDGLANENDRQAMQGVLEATRSAEDEPEILGSWFIRNPTEEARVYYRKLAKGNIEGEWTIALILAGMADREVLAWAKNNKDRIGKNRWMCFYVLALSPLDEADEEIEKVIREKEFESIVWAVQGYQESKAPRRMDRIEQIAGLKEKPRKLIFWLRRTLETWAANGETRAGELLKKLPVVESENG